MVETRCIVGEVVQKSKQTTLKSEKMAAARYTILEETDVPGAQLKKDPEKCTVVELKRWLECHSLKRSGKKDDLVERVKAGIKTNLPVNPNIDGGKWYDLKANKIKTGDTSSIIATASDCQAVSDPPPATTSTDFHTTSSTAGLPAATTTTTTTTSSAATTCDATPSTSKAKRKPKNVPFKPFVGLPSTGWKHFPSRNIPFNFNYGHVYFYLVESLASAANIYDSGDDDDDLYSTCDTVTEKPLRKGRDLLKSENVHRTEDNFDESKQEYMLRSHVHHSMKGEDPLNTYIVISNVSGSVKRAGCDCRASAIARCCHVAALLLKLSDRASENTFVLNACTSEPCPWDKGQKRAKQPEKLHEAKYSSSKRKPPDTLYNFDPRPAKMRTVSNESVRNFTIALQNDKNPSMWESLLPLRYENFNLDVDDIEIYSDLSLKFIENIETTNKQFLGSRNAGEIPGTMDQADSDQWHHQRRFRITASTVKSAVNLGENLSENASLHPHRTYIEKKLWGTANNFTSPDMVYGIQNEKKALKDYGEAMNVAVGLSGLWINEKYSHLAASPDGLIFNDGKVEGIVEVKCLKILRLHTINDILNDVAGENCMKAELSRQCFRVSDDKLILKKSHMYYFQIQLQLLITGTEYCDFVLYCDKGPPSIERILPDLELQQRIVVSTRLFWEKVFIPEYFLMRIPRDLLPIVL